MSLATQLDETARRLRAQLPMDALAVVQALDRLDQDAEIYAIADDIVAASSTWARIGDATDLCAVRFSWIGADVEPWIASDVWSTGFAGPPFDGTGPRPRRLFSEVPGFAPRPLLLLYDTALEGEATEDSLEAAEPLFLAYSLAWAARALERPRIAQTFERLRIVRPFHFLATPGHDEPSVVIGRLE